MKTRIAAVLFFWQMFCLAEVPIHVHDCSGTLSEPARKIFNEAQGDAGIVFKQRFGEEFGFLWDGDCGRDATADFRVVVWEKTPKQFRKEHEQALAFVDDHGEFVVRYDFAEHLAKQNKISLPKILGTSILSVFAIHVAHTPNFSWNRYDLQFINRGLPQGFTNEIVSKTRIALFFRSWPWLWRMTGM